MHFDISMYRILVLISFMLYKKSFSSCLKWQQSHWRPILQLWGSSVWPNPSRHWWARDPHGLHRGRNQGQRREPLWAREWDCTGRRAVSTPGNIQGVLGHWVLRHGPIGRIWRGNIRRCWYNIGINRRSQ